MSKVRLILTLILRLNMRLILILKLLLHDHIFYFAKALILRTIWDIFNKLFRKFETDNHSKTYI